MCEKIDKLKEMNYNNEKVLKLLIPQLTFSRKEKSLKNVNPQIKIF